MGKEQKSLLIEFDDKIFNALIDRIEVLGATHFAFALRNGESWKKNVENTHNYRYNSII